MRLLTTVIQKMGQQKIVLLGSIKGISINGKSYEVRDNGAVSYLFIDTDSFNVGRSELLARDDSGSVRVFSFMIQKEPVDLNYDVLNTPVDGYKTNTKIDNESLQMPFDQVQGKFDALVDQLRRQGIIL
jgi:hypothetical protein